MSLIFTESPKHCANRGGLHVKRIANKKLIYAISTFFFSLLALVVVVWLVLHPSKPEFHLQEVEVSELSLSAAGGFLNSTIHATLVGRNPNSHVGVYYDELRAYAEYAGERITGDAELPSFYQGDGDTNLLTTTLGGARVPVYSSIGYEVGRDQIAGKLLLQLRLDGQLRWKVGTWVSGKYPMDVDCAAEIGGVGGGTEPMRLIEGAQCSTTV